MNVISDALKANLISWGWHAGGEACLIVEVSAAEYAKLPITFDMEFSFQPFEATLILTNDGEMVSVERAKCQTCQWDENGFLVMEDRPSSGSWFQLAFRVEGIQWSGVLEQCPALNVSQVVVSG